MNPVPKNRSGADVGIAASRASISVRPGPAHNDPLAAAIMPRHILYAYVDGSDVEDIADRLDTHFEEFVQNREWVSGRASVVNQRHDYAPDMQAGDLPDWDLGLNLELPDSGAEPHGWFADVEAVATFLGTLHRETGRDFIIGIADTKTGVTEDLFDVRTDSPELDKLRAIVGVKDVR